MSTMVGFKAYSRSAKIGLGLKDAVQGKFVWANLDNPRVARDLARHTTLGQISDAQSRYQLDTAQVSQGGVVAPRQGSLVVDVTAVSVTYIAGTDAVYTKGAIASAAAATPTLPNNANNQIVAVGLDTSTPGTPTVVTLANATPAVGITEERFINDFNGLAITAANIPVLTTADRTWLALVFVPQRVGTTTGVAATGVFTKAAHGLKVGDQIWFDATTGATAGISTGTVYYVRTVPTSGTFTVSASSSQGTPGALLTWTTDITAASWQKQIQAIDVVDTRP